ncbi:hypothetical protein PFISCL1PPCAC_10772 [Pristionchus fissidentatus]|uniref:Calponin-homology (CH) domain-containing protein n=1 Tax=Pristionchus fissidentatus TaxID=1538716 RepID=A0AAV5VIH6_9BILA|nr:hypothetical protein PFISCL1PPCAC_10772 [Pristionchus fissidentatus]
MWNYFFGQEMPPTMPSGGSERVSMELAPERQRASIASTLSSTTTKEEKRGFGRTTSQAWEKFSNVIRKPSARRNEAKIEKQKMRDQAELEPRVQFMESSIRNMGEELESMRRKQVDLYHPFRSLSSSNLRPSPSEAAFEELASVKEELAATMAELKEMNERHTRLQHAFEKERREKEMVERELQQRRKQLDEGSVPFIDSDASPRVNYSRRGEDKENHHESSLRVAELEMENEALRTKQTESQRTIQDMILVVRAAQRLKDEAESEVKRCREVHRTVEGEEDIEMWTELKRGREPTSRRNALLSWVQETLATDFPSITVTNFSSSWFDGRALAALISVVRPDTVSRSSVEESSDARDLATKACKELGIQSMNESLLTTFGAVPDWNKVMSVVLEIYKRLFFVKNHTKC